MMSSSSVRLTLYNHKGGVGKTTLTINVGAALARKGKRVLLVDSDPQCNLTAHFFDDESVNDLLDHSDEADGHTIWTAIKPVADGTGHVIIVDPFDTVVENLLILPGDIRLSEFEQDLGDFWTDCFKRRLGGLRATASLSTLIKELVAKFDLDYVMYDTGPNIGPLNRSILLDCDFFIVPVACDLFSVRALATLGQSLKAWILDWETISALAPDEVYLLKGKPKFLGYIPQRFKVYGQAMAKEPRYYLKRLDKQFYSDVASVLQEINPALAHVSISEAKLGEVKEFGTLIQMAQRQGVPLSEVHGGSPDQKSEALRAFSEIADKIIETTGPTRRIRKKRANRRSR